MYRNENGAGIAAIIVAVIALAIITTLGILLYKNIVGNSSSTSGANSTTDSSGKTPDTDVYVGWKTYSSIAAGYLVKYPSDWVLKEDTNSDGVETVRITGADDFVILMRNFTQSSAYGKSAFAANPDGTCSINVCLAINDTNTVPIPGYGSLNIVSRTAGAGGGTFNELALQTTAASGYILSPSKAGVYSTFEGSFQSRSEAQNTNESYAQFAATSDVNNAILIYKSLSY